MQKNEFSVLVEIERNKEKLTQRKLAELTGLSVGTINKIIADLNRL